MTTATPKSLVLGPIWPLTEVVKVKTKIRHAVNNAASDGLVDAVVSTMVSTTVESSRRAIGISRHGLLAAEQRVSTPTTRTGLSRVLSMLMGSTLVGLGVSLFVRANLGVPAYDVMLTALRDRLGISLGQAGWLFTGLLLIAATLLGKRPNLSTVVYALANGLAIDTFMQLLREPQLMAVRVAFVVLGTLAIAGAIALVLHAGLTGGALDLLMKAGEQRGLNPFLTRTGLDVGIVVIGVLLGGDIGLATAWFVLTLSPTLRAGQRALADHRTGRRLRLESDPARW